MKRKFQPAFTHQKELTTIKELISENPDGLNIKQISQAVFMNRNSVAKYLDMLMMSGQVELRQERNSKLYYPSHRVPVSKILDILPELVVFIDSDYAVAHANEPFLEFTGISELDLIDQVITETPIPVLDNPVIQDSIHLALGGEEFTSEIHVKHGGSDTFLSLHLVPIVLDDGSHGAAIFLRDITRQKDAEKQYRNIIETQNELRVTEDKYRELAELLPVGVFEMDEKGRITWTNGKALELFGYTKDDLREGINLYQLFMGDDRKRVLAQLGSGVDSPEEGSGYQALKKDGTPFHITVRSVAVLLEGKPAGRRGIILSAGSGNP